MAVGVCCLTLVSKHIIINQEWFFREFQMNVDSGNLNISFSRLHGAFDKFFMVS
jgi:hypothetical protein